METQQSDADDRGTRDEKRCEVNGVECPNWVTGKRLTRAIDDLGRNSQNMPMSRSRDQVSASVGGLSFRQFLERDHPQQYAITLDQRQVRSDNDFGLAEQAAHRRCGLLVKEP